MPHLKSLQSRHVASVQVHAGGGHRFAVVLAMPSILFRLERRMQRVCDWSPVDWTGGN